MSRRSPKEGLQSTKSTRPGGTIDYCRKFFLTISTFSGRLNG